MWIYLLKKLLQAPLTIFILITISFFMVRFTPGGPFSTERNLDPVVEKALKAKYNMDSHIVVQYCEYLLDIVCGDLGPSFKHKTLTVNEIIAQTLPPSITIGLLSFALAMIIGVGVGIIAALNQHKIGDKLSMLFVLLGLCIPTFVIGPLLQLWFSMSFKLFPVAGYEGATSLSYLILPALTLSFPYAARIARLSRGAMVEALSQDFIRTARSKGMSEVRVILSHALRVSLLPVVSFTGPALAGIVTGSIVVEKVFQIPGLGREFVEGALSRDYTLVLGTVIVYGAFIIFCNLIADILYAFCDPRVSLN
jgi:oligopeptide transport system permease protein